MIQRIKDAIAVLTGTKAATEAKPSTIIHKVEITVSSNQAPNQIARDVFAAFASDRQRSPGIARRFRDVDGTRMDVEINEGGEPLPIVHKPS